MNPATEEALERLRCEICGRGKHPIDQCSCVIPKVNSASIVTEDVTTYWVLRCVHGNICLRIPTLLQPAQVAT